MARKDRSSSLLTESTLPLVGGTIAVLVVVAVSAGDIALTPTEWLAAALVLVNLILVGVTVYYAQQAKKTADYTRDLAVRTGEMAAATQNSVQEMRESRQLGVRPKLALNVEMLDPKFGVITVTNIGQGAAVEVEAELDLIFNDGNSTTRRLHIKTFLSDERHQYLPKHPSSAQPLHIDEFAGKTKRVRLQGVMHDVYGDEYAVEDELDVAEMWSLMSRAERRFTEDPTRKVGRELEGIREWLEKEFRPESHREHYGPDEAPF